MQDGLNWFAYCINRDCLAFKQLVVANRGFGIFKLDQELNEFACPVCDMSVFELRNMGFVNCEWAIKGAMRTHKSKIIADGQTFDGKLYTFKETDYKTSFEYLNIFVKKKTDINLSNVSNSDPSCSSISCSNYGPSSRRVEMNMKKNLKSPKKRSRRKHSDDSLDFNMNDGKLLVVKK